jgi:hypothetical protein
MGHGIDSQHCSQQLEYRQLRPATLGPFAAHEGMAKILIMVYDFKLSKFAYFLRVYSSTADAR